MKPQSMESAPKNGSRILLHYYVIHYIDNQWQRDGEKWEDCFWLFSNTWSGWMAWSGTQDNWSTNKISEEDAIEWLPIPN